MDCSLKTSATLVLGALTLTLAACAGGDAGDSGATTSTISATTTDGQATDSQATDSPTTTDASGGSESESATETSGELFCDGGNVSVFDEGLQFLSGFGVVDGPSLAEASCYQGSGAEHFVNLRFGNGGSYTIRAKSSGFDLRIAAFAEHNSCGGTEIACLADPNFFGDHVIYKTFAPNTDVTFVVDAVAPGMGGEAELDIQRSIALLCNFLDTYDTVPPFVINGDISSNRPEDFSYGSCGGANFRDTGVSWYVTATGSYKFTLDAQFDAILYIAEDVNDLDPEESNSCMTELACVNAGGLGETESVILDLVEGQEIGLIIDGAPLDSDGIFTLAIDPA